MVIKNEHLKLTVRPLGAKMVSLVWKKSQKPLELLFPPPTPPAFPTPSVFDEKAAWGGDICLPSVSPAVVVSSDYEMKVNDHGDFWTKRFRLKKKTASTLMLSAKTREFLLDITFSLQGATLTRKYRLKNITRHRLPFIFADHLLLPVTGSRDPKDYLDFHGRRTMKLEWSYQEKIGKKGDQVSWPFSRKRPFADKLFAGLKKDTKGFFQANYNGYNDYNRYNLSLFSKDLGCLGYWHTEAGWNNQYNLGLELTNSPFDNLSEAVGKDQVWWLDSGKTKSWCIILKADLIK